MDASAPAVPDGLTGYLVEDLRRFLSAADERSAALQHAIAAERERRDAATQRAADATASRRHIADVWIAAETEAFAIRRAAEAEAQRILEQAERAARGLSARLALAARARGAESTRA